MKKDLAVKGLIVLVLVIAIVNFVSVLGGSFHHFIQLLEFMGILAFIMIGILFVVDFLSKRAQEHR